MLGDGDQRLRAAGNAERLEDCGDVDLDRTFGQTEARRSRGWSALDHQAQHIGLTLGEAGLGRRDPLPEGGMAMPTPLWLGRLASGTKMTPSRTLRSASSSFPPE